MRYFRVLLVVGLIVLDGCRYSGHDRVPSPHQAPPAQVLPPVRPPQLPSEPAPAPAPQPSPPPMSEPMPVPPPDTSWVDALSRTGPVGVVISYTPTKTDEEGSARVSWTAGAPISGYLVGLDAAGVVVAVDYRGKGRTSGRLDVFRRELVRVARWDVAEVR